jgi:hypothetical protein
MNIDVEGAEYEVLRGFSLDRYQVGAFTIEHNFEIEKRELVHKLLAANGYVRVRSWKSTTGTSIATWPPSTGFSSRSHRAGGFSEVRALGGHRATVDSAERHSLQRSVSLSRPDIAPK